MHIARFYLLLPFLLGAITPAISLAQIETDGFFESEADFERAQCALSEEVQIIKKTQNVPDDKLQDCQNVTSLKLSDHLKLIELQVGSAKREGDCGEECENQKALFLADHKQKKITPMPFNRKWVEDKKFRENDIKNMLMQNINIDFSMGCSDFKTDLSLAKNSEGKWGFKISLVDDFACGAHFPIETLDDYQKETPYSAPSYRQLVRSSFSEVSWSGTTFVLRKGTRQEWDFTKLNRENLIKEGLLIRETNGARVVFGEEAKAILEDFYARH